MLNKQYALNSELRLLTCVYSSCPLPHLQIDRQLQTYLQRVEAVLGKDWEKHVEGQKLKQDGDSFRQKLNTMQVRVQERDFCSEHVKREGRVDSTFYTCIVCLEKSISLDTELLLASSRKLHVLYMCYVVF